MKNLRSALLGIVLSIAGLVPAFAQTSPNWTYGYVPTTAQWNALWASKQDYLGAPPLLTSGGTMTGALNTVASTTVTAGLNIPPGVAPTTPINGDIWTTSLGIYVQINGATVGPLAAFAPSTGALTITSASANALAVGPNGTTNPAFNIDASTVSSVTGIKIKSATVGNGVTLSVLSTTTNEALNINSKGSGTISLHGTSTGGVTIGNPTGGDKGAGTLNIAAGIYSNGTIISGTGTVSSATIAAGTGVAVTGTCTITTSGTCTVAVDKATAANYYAGTSNKVLTSDIVFTPEVTVTFSTTPTFDFGTFINGVITLTNNISSITATGMKAGQAGRIVFIQDATGSRTLPGTFNANFKFPGGLQPVLSTAANAIDVIFYDCRTTSYCLGSLNKAFN